MHVAENAATLLLTEVECTRIDQAFPRGRATAWLADALARFRARGRLNGRLQPGTGPTCCKSMTLSSMPGDAAFSTGPSVTLPANAKVGLVGRNGVGKSTLFKLILGELSPDRGDILLPRGARVASVDQEHPATPVSLLDTILAADAQRDALYAELETAEPERIADIYARLSEVDADRAPAPRQRNPCRSRLFNRRSRPADGGIFPAAGACALHWRPLCSLDRICCCSMNRPTTSTWRGRCGWRRV